MLQATGSQNKEPIKKLGIRQDGEPRGIQFTDEHAAVPALIPGMHLESEMVWHSQRGVGWPYIDSFIPSWSLKFGCKPGKWAN